MSRARIWSIPGPRSGGGRCGVNSTFRHFWRNLGDPIATKSGACVFDEAHDSGRRGSPAPVPLQSVARGLVPLCCSCVRDRRKFEPLGGSGLVGARSFQGTGVRVHTRTPSLTPCEPLPIVTGPMISLR